MRLTPLCPAGHLPHKGGDRQAALPSLHSQTLRSARPCHESISPPVGEMPGRAEGGKPQTPKRTPKNA
ncbi:lytic murein transglycosylase [Rhizobium rhizogenes]|uniref:Lytic murein transglycosylase n=1 Tax=Rhizobium rhizogenes TaxID=359 RepID=A0AA95AKD7_RHIRH|nr:lytic murein transglycosylase [Agrobacterium tumefaciens]TRA92173.1 lytic murein transglycosylase [Rhizobium rhizogenes]